MWRATYPAAVDDAPRQAPVSLPARSVGDAELAVRIAAGRGSDGEAEAELCRRFAPRVRLYGLRHLRHAAAAADLVQEVLVSVLVKLRSGALRDPERIGSFVLGSCRLEASSGRRAAERRDGLLERFAADLAPAGAGPPPLDLDRLDRCLEKLPPRDRAVLTLTFFAGRSSGEIADELSTTPGNVRVVRHRAVARLRGCMGLADEERRS